MDVVLDEAFARYLVHKHAVPRSGAPRGGHAHPLAERGLLRMAPEQAAAATLAASIGCVMRLLREGGTENSAVSHVMRDALITKLTGLLRQWLAALADRADAPPGEPRTRRTPTDRAP